MCGICGIYNFKNKQKAEKDRIVRMTNTIVHRGPDDEGYLMDGPLGLGFRRLSIIDLQGGHQPMSDKQEKVWIIFNGEIYNYPELRQELEGYGHVFRTSSDTEVIINGYKQWGQDVFNHLNGMFGLAIWDVDKKRLILARDAMGIKFVYYKITNDGVIFGSEIKPIVASNNESRPDISPAALNLFLRYRYTPSPYTIYENINKLAPGTMLICENQDFSVKRWYNFKPTPFSPMIKIADAREELLEIYKRAVKRHLLSDVPLGLLLSGGVDSGLLLGLMNLYGKNWPTFTIGYGKGYRHDELEEAEETSNIFNSNHVPVEINQDIFEKNLPEIVSFLEEPIATSSIVPMYFVCQRAREDVKVALVGQGPDELYGGYRRHLGVQYGGTWRKLPSWLQSGFKSIIRQLPRNESLKRGLYSLDTDDRMMRYRDVFSIMPGSIIDGLFRQGILPENSGDNILEAWSGLQPLMTDTDELGGFQFLEIRSSLPDELLLYGDKLSMAHSLEVRVPYLDREVVEFTERLSANFKVRYGNRKWLHKKVCGDFLPDSILKRKKRGFAVDVVDNWFNSTLSDNLKDFLLNDESLMYRYLNKDKVKSLLDDHVTRKSDNHKLLFSLVLFEQWMRIMKN
jgi:asparagine synthase (glutamine-hydrolysing)